MARRKKRNADQALILVLACGATVESAARKCSVSESTVYRRLQEPAFKRQVQNVRGEMLQRTSGALAASSMEAVKALLQLLTGGKNEMVRLGAGRAVLDHSVKFRESADLEERLTAVEAQLAAASHQKRQ
jgi:hypothetical protein